MAANPVLVREIAERIDDGRPVYMPDLVRELDVAREDLDEAYDELARRRGSDPLIDRARQRLDKLRRMAQR